MSQDMDRGVNPDMRGDDQDGRPRSAYARSVASRAAEASETADSRLAALYAEPGASESFETPDYDPDYGSAAFGLYPDALDDAEPDAAFAAKPSEARERSVGGDGAEARATEDPETPFAAEADRASDAEAFASRAQAFEDAAPRRPRAGAGDETAERAFAGVMAAVGALGLRFARLFGAPRRPERREPPIAPALRQALYQGGPLIAGAAAAAAVLAFPPTREAAVLTIDKLHQAVLSRPELRVRRLELIGAERVDATQVIAALDLGPEGRASLAFDAAEARKRIEALGWVKHARVALRPPQTLEVEIRERTPAMLWRKDGTLRLLDPEGVEIERPGSRRSWPGLPLMVGLGANEAITEALALDRAARQAGLPIAALTRIGARRWDLELAKGPRVRLPERDPRSAIDTVGRWIETVGLLEQGFEMVDLRVAYAPVARRAAEEASPNPDASGAIDTAEAPARSAPASLRTVEAAR